MALKKELNLFDVFCIASGAMISSGLFILPGIAHFKAGPAVIFSYLIAGIISIAGMLSIAEMTTAMPKAGGDCFTIIRSMGPGIGTVAGLLSWFSLAMKSAFALVGMSVFTKIIVNVDIHIIAVFFCLVFLFINLIGIKEAGKTQIILVVGLFILMIFYIGAGVPHIKIQYLSPFAPNGIKALFSTAGFVFVSYAGLLKIASIAEEIKNPAKNIPAGMILSLVVVSIFYTLMIFVTSGVIEPKLLHNSYTPISDAAEVFLGNWGKIILSLAAIFAFLSTANAGIMTSARSLVPLSRDKLLPASISNINSKFNTPHNALIITGVFILISLFLKFEVLVEAASIVLILTNILACFSVIILRESKIQNYRPSFLTPFYPWMQIFGIIALLFLLFEMGGEAIFITLILIIAGFSIYWFYGRKHGKMEFAMLHIIERITAKEFTDGKLESELKEIIRERDEIIKDRFDELVENSIILDLEQKIKVEEFFELSANKMSTKLNVSEELIYELLLQREKETSTVLNKWIAIPHIIIDGNKNFCILIARAKEGISFSDNSPNIKAVFVLAGTIDERNFHLRVLASIAQIIQDINFEKRWMSAKGIESLRDTILLSKRQRHYD
ncbi:MAG: amino acid permease [bacterium]